MNGNGSRRRCRGQSSPAGPPGAGQGGEPRGGGRGRCFGGGQGGRFAALEQDPAGPVRPNRTPWDLVEALETRIAALEARLADPGSSEATKAGDRP